MVLCSRHALSALTYAFLESCSCVQATTTSSSPSCAVLAESRFRFAIPSERWSAFAASKASSWYSPSSATSSTIKRALYASPTARSGYPRLLYACANFIRWTILYGCSGVCCWRAMSSLVSFVRLYQNQYHSLISSHSLYLHVGSDRQILCVRHEARANFLVAKLAWPARLVLPVPVSCAHHYVAVTHIQQRSKYIAYKATHP